MAAAVRSVVAERSTPPMAYVSRISSIENVASLLASSNVNHVPDVVSRMLKSFVSTVGKKLGSFFARSTLAARSS